MKIWCILCLGLHHSRLKPPIKAGPILPYFNNNGCLLWAIECPTQPTTIWVKAKRMILTLAYWVVQAIKNVVASKTNKAASNDQIGWYKCWIFLAMFSYSRDDLEGCPFETILKDLRIFSAWSEWRHLKFNKTFYLKYSVKSFLYLFILSINSNPPGCLPA